MRKAHILTKNYSSEKPSHFIFFDTETKEIPKGKETELALELGVCCYWNIRYQKKTFKTFKSEKEFWNFVFDKLDKVKKTKLYLIAHNVSFDFRVVKGFEYLGKRGYQSKKFIYNGSTNIWEFIKDTNKLIVLDNMNFFKSSLKNLGHSVGLEKMEMPDIGDNLNLEIYCKRDVEIMIKAWELYLEFLKTNDLGNFAKTIAGQAFNAYRHKFMFHPIFIHNSEAAVKLERESYHGGRTECFRIGVMPKENYYLLDVNSMYPSLMMKNEYPAKLINYGLNMSLANLEYYLSKYCVIAKVILNTDKPIYSFKIKERLCFPIGTFESVLTTNELKFALENNHILKIKEFCAYEKENLFSGYVKFFFDKRQQYKKTKNTSFEYMCKLFLNSLYGKFGQRNERYEKIGTCPAKDNGIFEYFDLDKDIWVKERRIGGIIERSVDKQEGYNSLVAISSHITADARLKLWAYIQTAGRENVYYCDTDSVLVNTTGYYRLKKFIGNKLGDLSLKQKSDNLKIFGCKDYEFGDDIVMKGIRKDAVKLADDEFRQVRFEGMAGAIRKNRINNMYISNIGKKLKREYNKGIVKSNGLVEPFLLVE